MKRMAAMRQETARGQACAWGAPAHIAGMPETRPNLLLQPAAFRWKMTLVLLGLATVFVALRAGAAFVDAPFSPCTWHGCEPKK